jgi:hypothetical protein
MTERRTSGTKWPPGLKPSLLGRANAALKGRSSTVLGISYPLLPAVVSGGHSGSEFVFEFVVEVFGAGLNGEGLVLRLVLEEVPGFAVAGVFLAGVAGAEVEAGVEFSDDVEWDDVPDVDGDEEDGEEVDGAGLVFFAAGADQVEAEAFARTPVDGGFDLHAEGAVRVVDTNVVAGDAEGAGDFHAVAGGEHHEIKFGPLAAVFAAGELASGEAVGF